jgi:hypothetical protein
MNMADNRPTRTRIQALQAEVHNINSYVSRNASSKGMNSTQIAQYHNALMEINRKAQVLLESSMDDSRKHKLIDAWSKQASTILTNFTQGNVLSQNAQNKPHAQSQIKSTYNHSNLPAVPTHHIVARPKQNLPAVPTHPIVARPKQASANNVTSNQIKQQQLKQEARYRALRNKEIDLRMNQPSPTNNHHNRPG